MGISFDKLKPNDLVLIYWDYSISPNGDTPKKLDRAEKVVTCDLLPTPPKNDIITYAGNEITTSHNLALPKQESIMQSLGWFLVQNTNFLNIVATRAFFKDDPERFYSMSNVQSLYKPQIMDIQYLGGLLTY